jgi:hypothetical protein
MVQVFGGDAPTSPWEEFTAPGWFYMTGGVDWLGHLNLTCKQY